MAIKSNISSQQPARLRLSRTVTMPSGMYYASSIFPEGKITVFPWTADTDEWFVHHVESDSTKVWDVVRKLADLKDFDHKNLLSGDANAIMLHARSIRTPQIEGYSPTCTSCGKKNSLEKVQIPEDLEIVALPPDADPATGQQKIVLPESLDEVVIGPITVQDEINNEIRDKKLIPDLGDAMQRMLSHIRTIGGGVPDSPKELYSWYVRLSPKDVETLRTATQKVNPHLSPVMEHECDFCKSKFKFVLPLTDPNFFR